ncbi:hypothetical protein [Nostoc sp.]|uniref:hypothetical protein n=1 Tax=Nostoc sp. TaxID=1180 RepID=UPI002FFC1F40
MNLETASGRSILYCTLDMKGHKNRTAKDAKGAKEERRRSDRCLKLELMGDRC